MNGFYNEILFSLGLSPEETSGRKVTIINFKGVYIEGHDGIIAYSPSEITVKLKKKILKITGENMTVAAISKDEIFIKGKIISAGEENVG